MATWISGYLGLASAVAANGMLTELAATGGYARTAVTLTYDPNTGQIAFAGGATIGPATGAWSAAIYAGIWDASTGGNQILYWGVPSFTAASGNSYSFSGGPFAVSTYSLFPNPPAATVFGSNTQIGTTVGTSGVPLYTGPVGLSYSAAGAVSAPTPSGLPNAVTFSSATVLNLALGNTFSGTLSGNATLSAPTGGVAGQAYRIEMKQDSTGSRTLAVNSTFKTAGGAPTLSTAASAVDRYDFVYDGTTYWGVLNKAYA